MHHGKHLRRLNRTSGHRKALLRNMVSSLIEHGRIETTVAKAKTIQPLADSIITLGKKGDVEAKRRALAYLNVNYFLKKKRERERKIPLFFFVA